MFKTIISYVKTFSTGLLIGAFASLFVTLIGFFAIFIQGVTHPPQNIHLSLLSQKVVDFTSTSATKFDFLIDPAGILYLILLIMLLGAVVFCILKGLFHAPSTRPSSTR